MSVNYVKDEITTGPLLEKGQRVRLTLGESVVVGTLTGVSPIWVAVKVDGTAEDSTENAFQIRDWSITVLPPPEPAWAHLVGAVVLDADGIAWQRRHSAYGFGWFSADSSVTELSYRELEAERGPLTATHIPEETSTWAEVPA